MTQLASSPQSPPWLKQPSTLTLTIIGLEIKKTTILGDLEAEAGVFLEGGTMAIEVGLGVGVDLEEEAEVVLEVGAKKVSVHRFC